jgi:hypothetical protein
VNDELDSRVPGTLRLSGQRWTALDGNSHQPLSDATGGLSPNAFGCIAKKNDACTMMRVARRKENRDLAERPFMAGRRLALTFLLCVIVLHTAGNALAQNVKSTYEKTADFKKYKKYKWGSNYLLTRQRPEDQARINLAIVDSINRDLQAGGFAMDQEAPDFIIIYEAGSLPKSDVGPQRNLTVTDMVNYSWGNLGGITSDVWAYSLAKMKITITDAATKTPVWVALASMKIHDVNKLMENLKQTVDKYIQKTLKDFPPKQ